MPSFGASSDYIHLRQENSSATLTSFLEPSSSSNSPNSAGVGQQSGTGRVSTNVVDADGNYIVDSADEAEVTFRDGVVLDFRPCQNKWTIFSRRSNLEKILSAFVAILLFLSLILLIIVLTTKNSTSSANFDRSKFAQYSKNSR